MQNIQNARNLGRGLILVMGLAGLSSFAQAAVVGQASASVSNYSYSVKDLDPDDGITPSFVVSHPWSYDASVSVFKYKEMPSGSVNTFESASTYDRRSGSSSVNVFNPKPLAVELPSGDGHVEIKQGGLSAAVTLKSDDFIGAQYEWSKYGNWLNGYAGDTLVGGPNIKADATSGFERWVLSPHSEVTFSGVIRLDTTVNAAAVTGLIPGGQVLVGALAIAQPSFYSNYTGSWNFEVIKNLPGDSSYVAVNAREYAVDAIGSLGQEHAQSWLEQSFSYTIRNRSSSEVDMYVGLSVTAAVAANPVPEPSSIALVSVGLGLMGAFARRRARLAL